jgi:predicted PurR-regulated permease PerM
MKNIDTPAQDKTTLIFFLSLLTFMLAATFYMAAPYMLAVVVGGILALLSLPFYKFWLARGLWPKAASLIVTIGIVLLVIIPISILVGLAVKQGIVVSRAIADTESYSIQDLTTRMSNSALARLFDLTPDEVNLYLRGWLQTAGKFGADFLVNFVADLPNGFIQIVLATVSCFFLILDGERFLSWAANLIPMYKDVRVKVVLSFKDMAVGSIWATLAAGVAQSLVMLCAFLALNVPGAFLAAGATFIFAWIPVLGSGPVWVAGAIYLYLQGAMGKVIAMVILGLVAGVLDNVVRPIVLQGRSNMHPLVSLVAIFGGIAIFGILGVFLGPVLAAVTISFLQAWPTVAERVGLMSRASEIDAGET